MCERLKKLCTPQTLICGAIILFFGVLAFLFPYSGDDWAWGSSVGISRLEIFFDNYNGRYFGNLLVMAITRSEVLKVILMALSYFLSCWLCYKYSESKKTGVLLFTVFTFLLMAKPVFAQSVVWSSGYSNYVPSAVISVGYLLIIKNITKQDLPQYPRFLFIATAVMGFSGALFMENITLLNICLGIAVIGYSWIKFKKAYLTHFSFLVGAIAGAVWMFTNTAYHSVATGEDTYRTAAFDIEGILAQSRLNLKVIIYNLFTNNVGICIVATILLAVLVIVYNKNNSNKLSKAASICLLGINALCVAPAVYRKAVSVLGLKGMPLVRFFGSFKFSFVCVGLFALTTLAIVLLCVKKHRRFAMLLPLYCVPVVVAPLLVVTPIGPRCFYITHLLVMVFLANLLSYLSENVSVSMRKAFCGCVAVTLLAQVVFYISVFVPIYKYDVKRNEFAQMQSDNQEEKIVVFNLPANGYVWCSSLEKEPWPWRYKLFHELNEELPVTTVTAEEFDEYYEEYISEHK